MSYPIVSGTSAWQYKSIPTFMGGIDTSKRPDQLEDSQCVQAVNVLMKDGRLTSDTGYVQVAGDIIGVPQREFSFLRQDQTVEYILVTTRTVYKWDAGSKNYRLLKGTAGTTTTGSYVAGMFTLQVVSTAGFTSGDLIGIETSDGDQIQVQVSVHSGVQIGILPAIPVGKYIEAGAAVIKAVSLNGSLDHPVDATVVASNNWLVITNGVDIVKRYDGADCINVPGLPSSGNVICNAVAVFNAALFLIGTTEGGTAYPWRVRRSDQGIPSEWVLGTAGKDDLLDNAEECVAGKLLGPYLIIYKTNSVFRGQLANSPDQTYQFDQMISADGTFSPNSIIVRHDDHIFVGNKNMYRYTGGYNLEELADPIFNTVFGVEGNLNANTSNRMLVVEILELNEIWIFYPSTTASSCDRMLRYNYKTKVWYERIWATYNPGGIFGDVAVAPETRGNEITGFGLFLNSQIFTWDDLVGSWAAQTWKWDSQVAVDKAYSVHLLCEQRFPPSPNLLNEEGKVLDYNYFSALDDGEPIQYTVESKEFLVPDTVLRFDMLEMYIRGTCSVYYSIDEGKSWVTLGNVSEAQMTKLRMFKQFPFERIRFRWLGAGTDFRLDWAGFSYKVESL